MIDARADIHPNARLGEGVTVGAWSCIGNEVEIGAGTHIGTHVVIEGPTRIGSDNRIHAFCCIGGDPQDKKHRPGGTSELLIGDRNVIREYTTINRGSEAGGGVTRVGNDNWILAYVHIAHDCQVGNQTVFANNATLAGHVHVHDYAILGGFAGVHQFCRVGSYAFCAISAVVLRDVPPFFTVAGNPARARGLNREGLRRHHFAPEAIDTLRRAYRVLSRMNLTLTEALVQLAELGAASPEVQRLHDFVAHSERGVIR